MYCHWIMMMFSGVTDDGKVMWVCPVCGKTIYIGIPYKTNGENYSDVNVLQKNKFMRDTFTVSSKE